MRKAPALTFALLIIPITGCWTKSDPEVVVYTALDAEFSRPIFEDFTRETGIRVRPKYDTEATKTVGLANAIVAESARPRADVFWNNEILNTLRLEAEGLLAPYPSPSAQVFPEMYRSPGDTWHGFAARARVLLVNVDLVPEDERPGLIEDLRQPKWRGRVGMAKPLFGTTATHAACLFAYWGDAKAEGFFHGLRQNEIQILAGNKQVARAVSAGRLAFGLTDTDDAIIEVEQGRPVVIVYPDSAADQMGTLFIPNTLAVIQYGPNPRAARRLIDYLLRPEVETRLAAGPSAQIPLNPGVDVELRVESPRTVKAMPIDFRAAADKWETAAGFLRDEFALGE